MLVGRARTTFGCLLLAGLGLSHVAPVRGATVECHDARGVLIISPAGEGSACEQRPVTRGRGQEAGNRSASAAIATPASFPRVDGVTQRQRDNDRQHILQDELADEVARMTQLERNARDARAVGSDARSTLVPSAAEIQDQLARSRRNILAIQRELAGQH